MAGLPTGWTAYADPITGMTDGYYGPDGQFYQQPPSASGAQSGGPVTSSYSQPTTIGPTPNGPVTSQTQAMSAPDTANTIQNSQPSGLPNSSDISADAPLPLQSFGATPSVTPSYAAATSYNPTYANAALVNPNNTPQYLGQEEAANAASLQPTFQAQDQSEQDQLAARGISSSGAAADLTNQLYGQQAATLAGLDAPAIQQQSGYQQQDITNNQANEQATNLTNAGYGNTASQYNATNAQNTNQFNAAEGTAASGTNAGYYDQAVTGNATTYNNYLSTLEGQGYNTGNEAYTAYLNSFGPNSGVTSGYNGAVSGIGNAATGAYDQSVSAEGAAIGGIAGAAGTAASGGAFSPAANPGTAIGAPA